MLQFASTSRNRSGGDNEQPVLLDFANADVDEIDGFQVTPRYLYEPYHVHVGMR